MRVGTVILLCQFMATFSESDKFSEAVINNLDHLVEVDQAFWINSEELDKSKPEDVLKLYHKRIMSINGNDETENEGIRNSSYLAEPNLPYPKKLMNRSKRDLPAIYQRDSVKSCTNAASTSIISGSKAIDFAAFAAGILTLVLNVNNNINNNNNNNNNLNINAVDSSNIVANFNTNNANQVNIMPTGRKRKRRSLVHTTSRALLSLIKLTLMLDLEENPDCKLARLCSTLGVGNKTEPMGALDNVLWSLYAVELNQMDSDPKNICQAADTQQKCNKMQY